METSDDLLGAGGGDLPARTAESPKQTAKPLEQVSEQARRNRRRRANAARGFAPPQLAQPGLLGLSGGSVNG